MQKTIWNERIQLQEEKSVSPINDQTLEEGKLSKIKRAGSFAENYFFQKKTSFNSSSSFDSPLASKLSILVTVSSSTTTSARGIGYNGGCTTDPTSLMLESVSAKGEVTFSGAKLDTLQ